MVNDTIPKFSNKFLYLFMLFKKNKRSAAPENNSGIWKRLQQGLQKTRAVLTSDLSELFSAHRQIDAALLEELETRMIMADVGIEATSRIIDALRESAKKNPAMEGEELLALLREQMLEVLRPVEMPLVIPETKKPFVLLIVGVNGAGKTTTIGKLTNMLLNDGHSVLLAAGDTFRAAAIEQIRSWGDKTGVPVIAQQQGADAAAVVYDALASARSRNTDVVIADTAGRLHNKDNLMEELKKIRRTITRFDPELAVETMLVLDACTGQNAVSQAQTFNEVTRVDGITLTKLDGTAKGGIIFALAYKLGIPIRFIGVGEQLDDLRTFNAADFIDALLTVKL